jgi:hypothetical protein
MIGIFFYYGDDLHAQAEALHDAEDYGDFKTSSVSHEALWETKLKKDQAYDFDYFPRGRVVYNKRSKRHTVYIDRDLNKPEIIEKITAFFKIKAGRYTVKYDEHYQCHLCNRGYVVLGDVFDVVRISYMGK